MRSSVIISALHRFYSSRLLHYPTIFVACVGFGLSLLSYHIVAESEHTVVKRDLSQAARRITVLLDKGLQKHRFELVSLQAFHAASEKVTRDEFQRYVNSMFGEASDIWALAWIPRVSSDRLAFLVEEARKNGYTGFQVIEKGSSGMIGTAPQRDEYFPVYYIEPLVGNEDLVGLDIASEPRMAKILRRARDTKKIVATGKVEIIGDDGKQVAFQLLIPVYSRDRVTDSVEKLHRPLEGFYAGIYRVDKFVENSLAHEFSLGIDVHVFDNTSPKGDQFLVSYLANGSPSLSLEPQDQASLHTGPHATVPLTVGQRNWLVIAKPTPSFLRARHTWKALITFIGGLLATLLVTGYFVLIQRGAARSQELAAIQTKAKQELEKEISDRNLAEQTLLREKKITDTSLDSLPGIFYLFNEKGVFLRWNKNFETVLGYSSQEVSDRSLVDYFRGEDKLRVAAEIRKVFSEGESSVEAELVSKDGTKTPYVFTGKRMLLDRKVCLVGMGIDVTARKEAEEALRASEAQLVNAVEMAHLGHWELDCIENEFTFNDQFYKLFRTTAEQVGGYTMSPEDYARRFVHPEETSVVSYEIRKAIETDDPYFSRDLEHRIVYADGEIGHISVRYFVVKDELGKTIRTYGVNQDITERKKIEEALRRSEERFRSLIEQAPDAITVNDYDGKFLEVNEQAYTSLDYTREELLTMNVSDIDPDSENRRDREKFWPNLPVTFEARHRRKDGSIFPVEIRLGSIDYGDSKAILAMGRDISERKLADQALQESEAKYRQLANVTFEGIAFHDHGVILQANDQFFEMFGYDAEELIGTQTIDKLLTPESAALARDKIASGSTDLYEAFGVRKDVSEFPIEVRATYVETGENRIRAVAIRDVSERKDMEKRLLESQKMEAVGTLAGGIAHDFNNLLQVIHGYSDMGLLYIRSKQAGYKELVEIKKAAKSAAELTQGLLTYSRRVEGKMRPVNVNQELKQISKMLERTIPKMIAIQLNLDSDLWVVKADPAQLHQTVMNLAVNARDAMPEGGKLVIETANVYLDHEFCKSHHGIEPGKYVLLTVSDTGCGIDKATQDKIFDPFFTTKEVGKGTGLGLSIVFGIVKSHGGTISCSTAPGKGTAFKIYLPAFKQFQERQEVIQSDRLIGGTETILLVDDEDAVRALAENILRKFGYSVLTVTNGREALRVFQEQKENISLIIMDLIMPEMGGRECLREIIRIDSAVKVLIASGYEADGQIDDALEEGATASIKKPYDARQLLDVVRRVLDDEQVI